MRATPRGLAALLILAVLVSACQQQQATPSGSPAASATPVKPVRGGTLTFVTAEQPASYDAHRETSPAVLDLLAPEYSVLYRADPLDTQKLIPDVASDQPQLSSDKLTVTVKLRTDVKFADGAALTSADVVASYQHLMAFAPRATWYGMVDSVSAPDPATVTFKLKAIDAGFTLLLADPWALLYSAAKLKQDPHFYETNVDGTGPFTFVSNDKGSDWTAKRNPSYFGKDASGTQLPYLDGFTALIRSDPAARVDAMKTKKAAIDFEGFTVPERNDITKAIGADLALQEVTESCVDYVIPNYTKAPFDNANVRQALTTAIDRRGNNNTEASKTTIRDLGGLMRPHSAFAVADSDLQNVKGFGTDTAAARDAAKKQLSDAGQASLSFTLTTPEGDAPYAEESAFLVDQWKQAGVTVTRQTNPAGAVIPSSYDVKLETHCSPLDEPDLVLGPLKGAFNDSKLDGMIDAQRADTDLTKRTSDVVALQKYVMDEKAYAFPVLWWYRSVPYLKTLRGWTAPPGHASANDLATLWIAPQ